jgi:hypothetical protein
MFRVSSHPSSGAYQLQKPPLVYCWNVVVAVLPPRSNGKSEGDTAVDKFMMMGVRMPETCWAVFKRQAINLKDWCIWLVDLFEYMMMHGLTNPKVSGYQFSSPQYGTVAVLSCLWGLKQDCIMTVRRTSWPARKVRLLPAATRTSTKVAIPTELPGPHH